MFKLHTTKQEQYFNEVIRLYYKEGYTKTKICRVLPIDRKTIFRWIEMYEQSDGSVVPSPVLSEVQVEKEPDSQIIELESRIKELERKTSELETQLKYERLRAELYNKMIEITESKFNIQIRSTAVLP